jgi:hypothetical protein
MAHVAFSRKALTDVPFLLTWLIALGLGQRFLERPGFVRALALGAAVGLAQNFKYNGWLAGVIVAVAALMGVVLHPEERRRGPLLRTFGWGLVAALTAALIYAPWYAFVEAHGGYAGLVRHHRGYIDFQWRSNWSQQLGQAVALSCERYTGALSGLIAGSAYLFATDGPRSRIRVSVATALLALFCSFSAYFSWWVGLGWSPWLVAHAKPSDRLLGASWLIMALVTPLYHPYARLWLPLHAAGWLLMAGAIGFAASHETTIGSGLRERRVFAGIAMACGISAAIHTTLVQPQAFSCGDVLEPVDPLRDFALRVLPQRIPQKGTTIRLYATRPLAFYLSLHGSYRVQLEPSFEQAWKDDPPGSWGVLDETMPMPPPGSPLYSWPGRPMVYSLPVDPIPLLDVDPRIWLLDWDRTTRLIDVLPPRAELHHEP